jgi:hypothetical protein
MQGANAVPLPPAASRIAAINWGAHMMTTFDKREEGFEKQFAHDEELRFKATARRNRMLGAWTAEKLGLKGADAETYAKSVVAAEFDEGHDVVAKIRNDLAAKGVTVSESDIQHAITVFTTRAVADIKAGR